MYITIKTSERTEEYIRLYVGPVHWVQRYSSLINGIWVDFLIYFEYTPYFRYIDDLLPFMVFPSIELRVGNSKKLCVHPSYTRTALHDHTEKFRVELDGTLIPCQD